MTLTLPPDVWEKHRNLIFEPLGYKPTELQLKVHNDLHRVKLITGGERGGKSFVGAKEAVLHVPLSKLIWLVANEYATCRPEFEYMMNDLTTLKLLIPKDISFPKEGACSFKTIDGCKVETKSADDFRKLGMVAPDFILVCEAAQIPYEAYLRLRGRIAEKRGKMVMTGTLESSLGWYPEYYLRGQAPDDDFISFSLPSWSNSYVFPGGRNDPEILKLEEETPSDIFAERYGAVPCPPSGLIMKEFSNAIHVGDYQYDPHIPVEIAVDPGYGGAYAVEAIQIKESQPYLVDEIYLQGYTTEDIITIVKQKPWGNKVNAGAIDVAGKQHQAMAAPVEVWQGQMGLFLESRWVDVEGGIELLRTFLKVNPVTNRPKLYVNHSCKGFISECGGCKSPVSNGGAWIRDVNTGKIIDRNNHATKAVIYWLVNRFGYSANKYETDYGKVFDFSKPNNNYSERIRNEWRAKILNH